MRRTYGIHFRRRTPVFTTFHKHLRGGIFVQQQVCWSPVDGECAGAALRAGCTRNSTRSENSAHHAGSYSATCDVRRATCDVRHVVCDVRCAMCDVRCVRRPVLPLHLASACALEVTWTLAAGPAGKPGYQRSLRFLMGLTSSDRGASRP